MSLVGESAWATVQARLKVLLSEVSFNQWFAQAEVMVCDSERFELGVQNLFYKSRIETAYMAELVKAVNEALGKKVEVAVSVSPRLLAQFRREQERQKAESARIVLPQPGKLALETQPSRYDHRRAGQKLNPNYTFDHFVVGPANRLSHAVALRAVEALGEYNPLYFCGQPGTGKTHLLQALCHELRFRHPDWKVVYATADKFVADFAIASTSNTLSEFREIYRLADVLVIDELQTLGVGKKVASQAELLGIIDELTAHGKQVVCGSTLTPGELEGVDVKLRDRLGAGFVDRLLLPDEETRRELIARKMAERDIVLPDSASAMLARELSGNVRKLEGAVKRLTALIKLKGMEPTTGCIRMALEVETSVRRKSALTFDDVIAAVCEEYGVTREALLGRGRTAQLRVARQVAIALCRYLIGGRYAELGETFGKRSHATIISNLKNISPGLFSSSIEGRPLERILFRLGVDIKPEDILPRAPALFALPE